VATTNHSLRAILTVAPDTLLAQGKRDVLEQYFAKEALKSNLDAMHGHLDLLEDPHASDSFKHGPMMLQHLRVTDGFERGEFRKTKVNRGMTTIIVLVVILILLIVILK